MVASESADAAVGGDVIASHYLTGPLLADTRHGLQQVDNANVGKDVVLGALIEGLRKGLRSVPDIVLQRCPNSPGLGGSCPRSLQLLRGQSWNCHVSFLHFSSSSRPVS